MRSKLDIFLFSLSLIAISFLLQSQRAIMNQSNPLFSESTMGLIPLDANFKIINDYGPTCQGLINCSETICESFYNIPNVSSICLWPDIGLHSCGLNYKDVLKQETQFSTFFLVQEILSIIDVLSLLLLLFLSSSKRLYYVVLTIIYVMSNFIYISSVIGISVKNFVIIPIITNIVVVLSYTILYYNSCIKQYKKINNNNNFIYNR